MIRKMKFTSDVVLRSILGVVMGYAVFAASGFALFQLTGQPPHGEAPVPFMIGAVAYGVAFALLGGYLSGWIAGPPADGPCCRRGGHPGPRGDRVPGGDPREGYGLVPGQRHRRHGPGGGRRRLAEATAGGTGRTSMWSRKSRGRTPDAD
jgi:hypothetical protein